MHILHKLSLLLSHYTCARLAKSNYYLILPGPIPALVAHRAGFDYASTERLYATVNYTRVKCIWFTGSMYRLECGSVDAATVHTKTFLTHKCFQQTKKFVPKLLDEKVVQPWPPLWHQPYTIQLAHFYSAADLAAVAESGWRHSSWTCSCYY